MIYDPDIANQKSTVAINLKDIERIEIIYEDDSDVWERLSRGNVTDVMQEKTPYQMQSHGLLKAEKFKPLDIELMTGKKQSSSNINTSRDEK